MAWIIKNSTAGTIIISDLNVTFGPHQIRDMDLVGRENAERSVELKTMLLPGAPLKQIKKDDFSEDNKVSQQLTEMKVKVSEATMLAHQLQQKNDELQAKVDANTELTSKVLQEIQAFSEKFPLQFKVYAEALRNIHTEKAEIGEKREALVESGASEAEIKLQERMLALKEKKLERNGQAIGKTMSESAEDVQETLDALDQILPDLPEN